LEKAKETPLLNMSTVIIGGYGHSGVIRTDKLISTENGTSFNTLAATIPNVGDGHCLVIVNDTSIFLAGGSSSRVKSYVYYRSRWLTCYVPMQSFSLLTVIFFISATFRSVPDMPNIRSHGACAKVKSVTTGATEIVATGGIFGIKIDIFNMDTLTWRTAGTLIFC
jgi:hypothetical protein